MPNTRNWPISWISVKTAVSYATWDELYVLQYARCYGVFEMPNFDKMKHSGSFGVQKNETVFKISWKHHKNAKRINKARYCKNRNTLIT